MAEVSLHDTLARKYPHAKTGEGWQYVFVTTGYGRDPRSGAMRRHHLDEKLLLRAMKWAVTAQRSPNRPCRIRYATVLPRIYSQLVTTSVWCWSDSALPDLATTMIYTYVSF